MTVHQLIWVVTALRVQLSNAQSFYIQIFSNWSQEFYQECPVQTSRAYRGFFPQECLPLFCMMLLVKGQEQGFRIVVLFIVYEYLNVGASLQGGRIIYSFIFWVHFQNGVEIWKGFACLLMKKVKHTWAFILLFRTLTFGKFVIIVMKLTLYWIFFIILIYAFRHNFISALYHFKYSSRELVSFQGTCAKN